MTRRNSIQTIHEPFGDAFYYGPERMGTRFENDEEARKQSGFAESTFKTILDRIERESAEVCSSPSHRARSSTSMSSRSLHWPTGTLDSFHCLVSRMQFSNGLHAS